MGHEVHARVGRRRPELTRGLLAAALTLAAGLPGAHGTPVPAKDGRRFRCGDPGSERICLPYVRRECRLSFVPGESLPPEAEEHVSVAAADGVRRVVGGPRALAGCVVIETPEAALDYLRFFSSYRTVHLFDEALLEVYPKERDDRCLLTCLAPKVWRRLRLRAAEARAVTGGFEVTRTVMRPIPEPWTVSLYRITEIVGHDGTVTRTADEPLQASEDDLGELAFPMYL